MIAFTGSREVGLEILREAYTHRPGKTHVKRVVCEMGGKNAVIVDDDADLDEAVVHIIDSAFGYQGQKCSAASRIILLSEVHDRLLARLVEATRSLKIGPPEDPRNAVGPVIEAEAQQRGSPNIFKSASKKPSASLEMAAPAQGFFVGPAIFSDVAPKSRIAQEEIFGPVLSVIDAKDFDHALDIANDSSFASDRRHFLALAGAHRKSAPGISRRQSLHQPRHHRRRRRAPAVRGFETFRHRLQSRWSGLSFAISRTADDLRKYSAPWVCAACKIGVQAVQIVQVVQNVRDDEAG